MIVGSGLERYTNNKPSARLMRKTLIFIYLKNILYTLEVYKILFEVYYVIKHF